MDQMPDEALGIDRSVGCTRIVGIPKEVIHTVNIKISVNYAGQWMFPLYDSAEFGRINPPFSQPVTCLFLDNRFNIIMGPIKEQVYERFTCMGKWPMPDVMEKGGCNHQCMVMIRKPEPAGGYIGKEHGAKRVFKPCMVGSGIDKIRKTELFYISEALECRGIEQGKRKVLHLYIAMDRVLDYLQSVH
jgi:hypothetical protein